jgi:hypothetical protein
VFCAKCGGSNRDGVQFCANCGAPLDIGAASSDAPVVAPVAEVTQQTFAPPPAQVAAAPQYAPPPAGPPVYAAPPALAPKKKRGCVIALVIIGALLLCCIGTPAAAYFGLLSLGKPRDLGVRYGEAEYKSAVTKLGIDVSQAAPDSPTATDPAAAAAAGAVEPPPTDGTTKPTATKRASAPVTKGPAKGTKVVYTGSRPIDVTLTSAEFSALMSMYHYSPNWLVQDLQVKFGDNGQMELSGYVAYQDRLYGGYASGTGVLTGPQSVGGSITKLEGLGVEVPQEYCGPAAEYLAGVMNEWLSQMDGLNLQSATIEGGQLHIIGSVPAKVVRVPAGG